MNENEIKKMWEIDHKAQLGQDVTEEEQEFFNRKYFLMLQEMKDNYDHWMNNTRKLNAT